MSAELGAEQGIVNQSLRESTAAERVIPGNGTTIALLERALAPLLALLYPFALMAFHAGVGLARSDWALGVVISAVSLSAAFAVPMLALVGAARLGASATNRRAYAIALLAVAAPAIFTFLGVVLYLLHDPVSDIALWVGAWILLALAAAWPSQNRPPVAAVPAWLRATHGGLALAALLSFLGFHILNHLFGLIGADAHSVVMKFGRHLYRAQLVEPVLVTVMLLLVVSGLILLWRRTAGRADRFQVLQAASGAYLLFFVPGHMNSVFVFARTWLGIDTDWSFATGAPAGLIADAWNVRLVPHYGLGVAFLLVHLAGGARIVLLAHGVSLDFGNRLVAVASAAASLVAGAILLGMCGVRVGL